MRFLTFRGVGVIGHHQGLLTSYLVGVLTMREGSRMSDMSWEHAAEARAALRAIVNDPEHGVAALSSAQTMSNLLKDLLPDAPREKSILVAAAEAGIATTLREHVAQGMDAGTAISLTASSLSATTPFTPDACTWVTGEIASVLGISPPSPGGGLGGAAAGFGSGGQQGMPTQIAPIPGAGFQAGTPAAPGVPAAPGTPQAPGQAGGFGQGGFNQGGGFGQAASDPQATRPGAWPPAGGFAQAATPGAGAPQAGGAAPVPGAGQPTVGAWQAGGAGAAFGQPGGAGAGFGQAGGGAGFGQPGGAAFGQAGTGQQAPGGWQGGGGPGQPGGGQPGAAQQGWQAPGAGFGQAGPGGPTWPQGAGGYGPGGGFGPIPSTRPKGRRGLWIGLGIAAVLVVIVVIAASLSGGGKHNTAGGGGHSPSVHTTPPTTPPVSPTPPTTGVDSLQTIMNPVGEKPVGTQCSTPDPLTYSNGSPVLNSATIVSSIDCHHTARAQVFIIGYQFDSRADLRTGLAHINKFVGFKRSTASPKGCPPPAGFTQGRGIWFANSNPKYSEHRSDQVLECDIGGKGDPQMIWAMPTQNTFFVAQDDNKSDTSQDLYNWWTTLNYG
jgi:hypothetical protein